MDMPPEAQRRLEHDHVVWMTTVADSGTPVPNPVWFAVDGDDLVIFTGRQTRKVHNLEQRPVATLHFNSDDHGGDVVVITGDVELRHDRTASGTPPYRAKYERAIADEVQMAPADFDRTYDTELRVHPTRVRLTAG
jgi:PPOX class probable F420-dependent enzyme